MQLDLSPKTAETLRLRAEAQGLSVSSYLEALLREPDLWGERAARETPGLDADELREVREAVAEGLQDANEGRLTPAKEVFAELRRRHDLPR